jgi:fructose-1,6-bisphosphatase
MWDEHLSKYQPGTITITGDNFDKVETSFRQTCGWDRTRPLPFTDDENKLINQVTDAASILTHYSDTEVKRKRVEIQISSRGLQNPMNFEYDKYLTILKVTFFL